VDVFGRSAASGYADANVRREITMSNEGGLFDRLREAVTGDRREREDEGRRYRDDEDRGRYRDDDEGRGRYRDDDEGRDRDDEED
jgi:hypothetical protein